MTTTSLLSDIERRTTNQNHISNRNTPITFGQTQPIYSIRTNNGYNLVEPVMQALGWKKMSNIPQTDFVRLRWTELSCQINYSTFRDSEQMINHFPNNGLISNKLGLLMCLRQYEHQIKMSKNRLPNILLKDIMPETYVVSDSRERELFAKAFTPGSIWISKPTGLNQGKGIYLVRELDWFLNQFNEKEPESRYQSIPRSPMPRIVQRYIERPLLLEGRKFDIRSFMVVANSFPYLVLYHSGYVRLSMQKYSAEDTDLATHLTNQFIQKKVPRYHEAHEDTVWSMKRLNDYINFRYNESSNKVEKNWVYNILESRMQRIMIHVFNTIRHKLATRIGFFEIFGLDFMIDESFKIWLIEVNTNPALHTNCRVLDNVLPSLIEKSLYVSIECFERMRKRRALLPLSGLIPWAESSYKQQRSSLFENAENSLYDNLVDSGKLYTWIRNPYNGLPSGFVILINEPHALAQMRASQSMSIPLRSWCSPRFFPFKIQDKPRATKSSDSSLCDEDANAMIFQKRSISTRSNLSLQNFSVTETKKEVPVQNANINNQQENSNTMLVGLRHRAKPKMDIVPYKERPFEQILRKYPAPSTAGRSSLAGDSAVQRSNSLRPSSTNISNRSVYLDKRVSDVYKSTIDEKGETECVEKLKNDLLPSPEQTERRSKPIRQCPVNRFQRPKKELPTRVPFQMTTVQVVTTGNNQVSTNQETVVYQPVETTNENSVPEPASETAPNSSFPKRPSMVKNGLGCNILQLLDGTADLGLKMRRASIYRSIEKKDSKSGLDASETKRESVFVDRSC